MLDKTIIALDGMDASGVDDFLKTVNGSLSSVKIGLELFCAYGKKIVQEISLKHRLNIFLDLKLHDIPTTVKGAVKSLRGLPISYLSVHLAGGERMLEEALKACNQYLPATTLIGISVLTSLEDSDIKKIWGEKREEDLYGRLFRLALKTGVPAVVLSPRELKLLKKIEEKHQQRLLKITPGIRFEDEILRGSTQDQKRVLSPGEAFNLGADFIVMGRSITNSKNITARLRELDRALP